jgi:hypothetical protein
MTQISRSEQMLVKAYRKLKKGWLKAENTPIDDVLGDFCDEFEAHFYNQFPIGN